MGFFLKQLTSRLRPFLRLVFVSVYIYTNRVHIQGAFTA